MKHLASILASCLIGPVVWAQVSLDEVVSRRNDNRIRAEFSCKYTASEASLSYKGTVLAQGVCFKADINGVETYCDGKRLVILDKENKEAYIQNATGLEDYLKANVRKVSELQFSELRFLDLSDDLSAFSFDVSGLGKDWIVTDLRTE
mgnify:CR=1 FL=1